MMNFIISNIMVLQETTCEYLLGGTNDPKSLYSLLQYVFLVIKVSVPVLIVVLCTIDFVKAVTSQDEKGFKEAQTNAIKRIAAGVIIFFVPNLLNIILKLANLTGTCGLN